MVSSCFVLCYAAEASEDIPVVVSEPELLSVTFESARISIKVHVSYKSVAHCEYRCITIHCRSLAFQQSDDNDILILARI
jgi:hypothetical protein